MENGWTGGQYSLFRVLLALALATQTGVVGALLAVPLALGWKDHWAAGALLLWVSVQLFEGTAGSLAAALPLVLHLLTPVAPFGSLDARGRPDPAGGWELPQFVVDGARIFIALALLVGLFTGALPLVLVPVLLLCVDPAWLAPLREGGEARLYYDGGCGVCHAAVRFVLAEDRDGRACRFAPLERFEPAAARAALPDSLVVVLPDRPPLVRSAALVAIGERLGGFWLPLAHLMRALPESLRDRAYDLFAANRKRFLQTPPDACPLLTPELRSRFD